MKKELFPETASAREAAEFLKISPKQVVNLLKSGYLSGAKICGHYVVYASSVRDFFAARIVVPFSQL